MFKILTDMSNISIKKYIQSNTSHIWFIHGFGETSESFTGALYNTQLTNNYSLFILDLPGCGGSALFRSDDYIQHSADEIATRIQQISANNEIIIITHSMGSLIGEEVANRLSEKIKLFISIEGFLIPNSTRYSSCIVNYNDASAFYDELKRLIYADMQQNKIPALYYEHLLTCSAEALYYWAKSCYSKYSSFLGLTCKRIYLCSDNITEDEYMLIKNQNTVKLLMYENYSHWPMYDNCDFYNELAELLNQEQLQV